MTTPSQPSRPSARPAPRFDPAKIRTALSFYRVMAIIAGIALFVLLFAVYLHYGPPKNGSFSEVWSPFHGLIYMVYAASIANLGFRAGWSLKRMVLNMLTGFVPVLPFIAEKRVNESTKAQIAALETAA